MPAGVYEFGEFRLDCGRFELCRRGRPIRLERKPMELLMLLAASGGQLVTRAEIAQRLWASEVFVDTEHGINTAVRKIRQVLGDDTDEPRFVQTVTGMGYRFVAEVVSVGSVAEIEASPDPSAVSDGEFQSRTSTVEEEQRPVPETASASPGRHAAVWLGVGGLAALGLALAVFPAGRNAVARLFHRSPTAPITSLAVIPLENLSGDSGQEYFADGMTDELTTMLAKESTLRVISRTSAMQYKGVHRPLREIAKELGVDGILEGSISRAGDTMHMTIQLIQAPTDTHLWAESYDRNANDVVTLPREAAQAIAKRLDSAAPPAASPRYVNPAAHDAYLHGRYLWFTGQYDEAFKYFTKATDLQPDYAAGWSGVSVFYGASAVEGRISPEGNLAKGEETASKAVQLDGASPEARLALCSAVFLNRWDWVRADQECKQAIELNPRFAEAYHFRSMMLSALNRHAEAIELQKKAMELEPFERTFALALSYKLARQYDAALSEARARNESSPNDPALHWILSEIYRCKGMSKQAAEEHEKDLSLQGFNQAADAVRARYKRGGYEAVIRGEIASRESKVAGEYKSPADLALYYAQLGNREKTLSLLEAGYRERSPMLLWMQCEPAFDFLHADARYRAIVKGVGLPPAY